MSEVRVFGKFRTFRVQNLFFDEISRWFCMVLHGEAQKHCCSATKFKNKFLIKFPNDSAWFCMEKFKKTQF